TITNTDGDSVFATAQAIVDHHSLAIQPYLQSAEGLHGRWYSWYGIGLGAITAVPFAIGKGIAHFIGHSRAVELCAVSALMPVVCGLILIALIRLARTLGATLRSALIIGVAGVAGSYLLPYSKEYFSEPVVVLCLLWCYERTLRSRNLAGGVALGVA